MIFLISFVSENKLYYQGKVDLVWCDVLLSFTCYPHSFISFKDLWLIEIRWTSLWFPTSHFSHF